LQDQLGLLRGDAIGARGKKQKKVVDPNKPKRAHSAYNEYIKDMVPKLKIAHPNKIHKELMSMAANQWSNLDDDSKKVCTTSLSFLDCTAGLCRRSCS
jgi:plasmid maintenance system killer protein